MTVYQTFEPGKYLDWEKALVEKKMAAAVKGPPPGRSEPQVINGAELLAYNHMWDPYNPLYNKKEYAQQAGYQDVIAWPNFKHPMGPIDLVSMSMEECMQIADVWYNGHGPNDVEFFAPVYPGDSLTIENEKLMFEDITVPGSDMRHFRNGASAKMYNQHGDLVIRHTVYRREAYRKAIEGAPPSYSESASEWMNYFPRAHYTTDEEWDYIKDLWSKEVIRGKDTLYWEDVNVGDQPPMACSGPLTHMDIIAKQGATAGHMPSVRDQLMSGQSNLFRDQYGQYLSTLARHYGGMNIPGARAILYNNHAAQEVTRMVTNWVSDAGFVSRIGWMFQQMYKDMRYPREGGEYLDQVPFMKGKGCTVHGMEGDTVLAKGYVTNKYINDRGEHIVDLVCWAETLDKRIIQVVPAAAKLPSRQG